MHNLFVFSLAIWGINLCKQKTLFAKRSFVIFALFNLKRITESVQRKTKVQRTIYLSLDFATQHFYFNSKLLFKINDERKCRREIVTKTFNGLLKKKDLGFVWIGNYKLLKENRLVQNDFFPMVIHLRLSSFCAKYFVSYFAKMSIKG